MYLSAYVAQQWLENTDLHQRVPIFVLAKLKALVAQMGTTVCVIDSVSKTVNASGIYHFFCVSYIQIWSTHEAELSGMKACCSPTSVQLIIPPNCTHRLPLSNWIAAGEWTKRWFIQREGETHTSPSSSSLLPGTNNGWLTPAPRSPPPSSILHTYWL